RNMLDARRRPERLDLKAQVAIDLFLLGALALHSLHLVTVPEQGEPLPRREQNHQRQESDDDDRLQQLTLPRLIDLANDRIVADVFFHRVPEIGPAHASLSIARSLALRARGLRATSWSSGTTGFRVSTRTAPSPAASARNACLTMRSSSEWNVMIANRAP